MGFMDKVMSKAQEVGKAGQAKVDEVQTKRHLDDLLRQMGALTYAAHAGREAPDGASKIEQLVSEVKEIENDHPGMVGAAATGSAGAPSGPGTFSGPGGAPVAVVPSAFSGAGSAPSGSGFGVPPAPSGPVPEDGPTVAPTDWATGPEA